MRENAVQYLNHIHLSMLVVSDARVRMHNASDIYQPWSLGTLHADNLDFRAKTEREKKVVAKHQNSRYASLISKALDRVSLKYLHILLEIA